MGLFGFGRPKARDDLYGVIYEGLDRSFCASQDEAAVLARVKLYNSEGAGVISDAKMKMASARSPKVYFQWAGLAEKYLRGFCVISNYYPKFYSDPGGRLSDFLCSRLDCSRAFFDRFFVGVEKKVARLPAGEQKREARTLCAELAPFVADMLPDEKLYYESALSSVLSRV